MKKRRNINELFKEMDENKKRKPTKEQYKELEKILNDIEKRNEEIRANIEETKKIADQNKPVELE